MARTQKLKVYRTPIGFHDAYVAAPSQKAALQAWGSDVDLFARGVAEAVTDANLTREPLERPGTVVRRPRGTASDYMATPPDKPQAPRRHPPAPDTTGARPRRKSTRAQSPPEETPPRVEAPSDLPPKTKPKPRPSRTKLDQAEQALDAARTAHDEAVAEIRRREKALQAERHELERRHEAESAKLDRAVADARDHYREALEKWRG
jgi:hypothetical protein